MSKICLYFQVHQPFRVDNFSIFDIGKKLDYFNNNTQSDLNNKAVLQKVGTKSYLPANKILLDLLKTNPNFKLSFSFSGVILEQLEKYAPKVLDSFIELVDTGRVEILSETYYHSLAFFKSLGEFESQVDLHARKIKNIFNYQPQVFRNTELSYNNAIAKWADKVGFKAILAEGWDNILLWRSANYLYKPVGTKNIKLLLKNYKLSDDIAFRFSQKNWEGYPLTAEKYAHWVSSVNGAGDIVNLFMDYETFGEHQWSDTGIFEFLKQLPQELLKHPDNSFVTPSEAAQTLQVRDEIDCPNTITWADTDRDLSAWLGNNLQKQAYDRLYNLEEKLSKINNEKLKKKWRLLQTSDHFYYMCTKWSNDGDVHAYFSPYKNPYEAFLNYMNTLTDLELRTRNHEVN